MKKKVKNNKGNFMLLFVLSILPFQGIAQPFSGFDSLNIRFVGNWPFGPSFTGAYDPFRPFIFLGSGGGIDILNISDPTNPFKISEIRTRGVVRGLFYINRLYIADDKGGLEIWDITNPGNPIRLGRYFTPNYPYDVYVSSNYAYVADLGGDLRIINVSNPANPYEVGSCAFPGYAYGVHVSGNYAYIAAGTSGLRIIDISDPVHPVEIGYYDTPGWSRNVYVLNNYAYIADEDAGLRIIDVSNPLNPYEIGFYSSPSYVYDCFVSGIYAYIADCFTGLIILDISNPSNPVQVAICPLPSYAYGVFVSGDYAYMAQYFAGIWIIDVSIPSNPSVVGSYNTDAAWDVYVAGDYAYLADGSTLRVIDVSNPATPGEIANYTTPFNATGVYPNNNYIYVTCAEAGLQIYGSLMVHSEESHLFFNMNRSFFISNLVKDKICLIPLKNSERIELYSFLGEKIKSWEHKNAKSQHLSLPLNGFVPGIYFLKIGKEVFKIIILK